MNDRSSGNPGSKEDLLELMQRGHDVWADGMAGLSDSAKAAPPSAAVWGAKATLAHMAHWNLVLLQALALNACGETVPFLRANTDDDNARRILQSRTRTWATVSAEPEMAYADLRGWVQRVGEEEVAAADDFAWQEGGPLWQTFLGSTYYHYLDHLAEYYTSAGQPDQAAALCGEMARCDERLGIDFS
jgi:hypothetical protein